RFIARSIAPRIGAASFGLVAARRAGGDRPVLTTATNRFLTAPIAALLGIADLVATELEVAATGEFTGRTTGIVNMRDGKVARLARWRAGGNLGPGPENSARRAHAWQKISTATVARSRSASASRRGR